MTRAQCFLYCLHASKRLIPGRSSISVSYINDLPTFFSCFHIINLNVQDLTPIFPMVYRNISQLLSCRAYRRNFYLARFPSIHRKSRQCYKEHSTGKCPFPFFSLLSQSLCNSVYYSFVCFPCESLDIFLQNLIHCPRLLSI